MTDQSWALFVDDERIPSMEYQDQSVTSEALTAMFPAMRSTVMLADIPPEIRDRYQWKIARSSEEAMKLVKANGLPCFMSLDHDLGGDDDIRVFLKKWVYLDLGPFPPYHVHSQNTQAKPWIDSWISTWNRFCAEERSRP